MTKINGLKLLKVFFILLLLSVCYFLFGRNISNATSDIQFPYNYSEKGIFTRSSNTFTAVDYFDYSFYDSLNDVNVTMPMPSNYYATNGNNSYKIIGIAVNGFNSSNSSTLPNQISNYDYVYVCLKNSSSFSDNDFFAIGDNSSRNTYIPLYYINNLYKSTEFKLIGFNYSGGSNNLYYMTQGYPGTSINDSSNGLVNNRFNSTYNVNEGLVKNFKPIYDITWNSTSSSWNLGSQTDSGSSYPVGLMTASFNNLESNVNDLLKGVEGTNIEFSLNDLNTTTDDVLTLHCSIYILMGTLNNEYQYWVFDIPFYSYSVDSGSFINCKFLKLTNSNSYYIYLDNNYLSSISFLPILENTTYCFFISENSFPAGITEHSSTGTSFSVLNTDLQPSDLINNNNLNYYCYAKEYFTTTTLTDDEKLISGINNNSQDITNINNTLTNSDVDNSSFDISGLGDGFDITDNTGVEGLFLILYNAFCTDSISSVTFTIPFVNQSFTIDSSFSNNYPQDIKNLVGISVWGFIALYVLLDIRNIINVTAEGSPEKVSSDVKRSSLC